GSYFQLYDCRHYVVNYIKCRRLKILFSCDKRSLSTCFNSASPDRTERRPLPKAGRPGRGLPLQRSEGAGPSAGLPCSIKGRPGGGRKETVRLQTCKRTVPERASPLWTLPRSPRGRPGGWKEPRRPAAGK